MAKEFNITGTCIPSRHYMADIAEKLKPALQLIEEGKYFAINRPRQFGKTTTMSLLRKKLELLPDYLPFSISFEGLHTEAFKDEAALSQTFFGLLENQAELKADAEIANHITKSIQEIHSFKDLSRAITKLVKAAGGRKVVIFIDEVDKSSDNALFVSFLGLLRTKYLAAQDELDFTFHSVVLAGLYDVKTLKLKLRPGEEAKYNSPWNIAADFDVDMSLHPHEIVPMLEDYCQEQGVEMDIPDMAERLYYHTSGYPFLVSKLCKIIAEVLLPKKETKIWTLEDLEASVRLLIRENNTNFDSLIKNLENNPELYNLAFEVVVNGLDMPFDPHEPTTKLGRLFGVFKENGRLKIHNRIYEHILLNYMTAKAFNEHLQRRREEFPTHFSTDNNELDLEAVLLRFQRYMREQYSGQDQAFLEREWRLVFLAFLKPIINGKGHDFKEVQVSEEKRLDVVLTYYQYKYVVELKRWYGPKAHEKGLAQLSDYLDQQHLQKGFLLIFEHRTEKTWRQERILYGNKEIFAVWV
ncbi:MAG TPA: AAA family ATPase [Saprospiraceae bacterium]|nr:AAA family ATPase [Saprospiraceae bacterium]HMQ83148.1 AAA family ATPase [Saprospiraceae bacterium]